MKKALVTGADGFIGSHLTESLLEKGYQVKEFFYYNSFKKKKKKKRGKSICNHLL